MTIWVTGSSGFVGSGVMRELAAASHACDDPKQLLTIAGHRGDSRRASVDELLALSSRPEVIVHCSGNASIRSSFDAPLEDLESGLAQTYRWLEFIRQSGGRARFVFVSTSAVYGDATRPSDESATLAPVSPYGLHKMLAEEAIRFYGRVHGVRSTVLRPLSVYGAGQRKQLIWDALCRFERGDFHFHGGADNLRDFIDVRDVAAFVPFAIGAASADVPVFNVSTGAGTSVRDALQLLARLAGAAAPVTFGDTVWPGDPRVLVGVNERARALGWAPRIGLEEGFASVVRWFQQLRAT